MRPHIDQTAFGSITIEGAVFSHDVIIRQNGQVNKRKKRLSKAFYGTSHVLSQTEAEWIYEQGTEQLILGTGQEDHVRLSPEAADYFKRMQCQVDLFPTPVAVRVWNEAEGTVIGFFHVTC